MSRFFVPESQLPDLMMMSRPEMFETFETEEKWLEARRERIGGSDAPVVLGLVPNWKSRFYLWAEKCGKITPPRTPTEYQYWGRKLEELIAERFARDEAVKYLEIPEFHQFKDTSGIRACTVDRMFWRGGELTIPEVLEIKTSSAFNREWDDDEIPLNYQVQIQHNLMVTDLEKAVLALLQGGQRFWSKEVEVDRQFQGFLREKEEEFWHLVQTETPPKPDDTASTTQALKLLYPEASEAQIALSAEFLEHAQRWDQVKEELAELNRQKRELENLIKAEMKEAVIGALPDGTGFSLKTTNKKAFQMPATSFRTLRRLKRV